MNLHRSQPPARLGDMYEVSPEERAQTISRVAFMNVLTGLAFGFPAGFAAALLVLTAVSLS